MLALATARAIGREPERHETSGLIRVRVAAPVVELHDALQCRKRAVVHVRWMSSDFTQARRLERTVVSRVASDEESPFVSELHPFGLPSDSFVPELAVAEVAPGVALRASGLIAREDRLAAGGVASAQVGERERRGDCSVGHHRRPRDHQAIAIDRLAR